MSLSLEQIEDVLEQRPIYNQNVDSYGITYEKEDNKIHFTYKDSGVLKEVTMISDGHNYFPEISEICGDCKNLYQFIETRHNMTTPTFFIYNCGCTDEDGNPIIARKSIPNEVANIILEIMKKELPNNLGVEINFVKS